MRKAWVFWVADYAAGIAAGLSVVVVLLLAWAWLNVFNGYALAGWACTVLGALVIAGLIRAVPYVRKRADEMRQQAPDESLSGLLRQLKEARTEREMREKREKVRGRRR